jgi:adenine-specific DNA-methyltransferase
VPFRNDHSAAPLAPLPPPFTSLPLGHVMIKYLGSKRTLLSSICGLIGSFPEATSVIDLFSGTSRVGHALKAAGYRVCSNDNNRYAHVLATCYVEADLEDVGRDAAALIDEMNKLPGKAGWFTETFCVNSRYFQTKNGERIDAIREAIHKKALAPELEAVLLVSLMEAADRVDSTTGVQMAYLKEWSSRSSNPLQMRMPAVLPRARHGKGAALGLDVFEALDTLEADVAYIDPPYNQHSYLGNYHVWESLVTWDKPEVYGIANKRMDCRDRKSPFNSRRSFSQAMRTVIERTKAPILIVSFNNEGFLDREEMEGMLGARRTVQVIETEYRRYIGAQIGIYNPKGQRVGKVSHLRNKEYLYIAAPEEVLSRMTPSMEFPAEVPRKTLSA